MSGAVDASVTVDLVRLPDRQEVVLFTAAIVGVTTMPALRATGVIVLGGGTVPVEGSVEDVLKIIKAAKSAAVIKVGEEKNGIQKRKSVNNKRTS